MSTASIDHVQEALDRLCQYSKGTERPNTENVLRALIKPFGDLEAALQQLLTQRSITTATGKTLDLIGNIVGQDRDGLSDSDYRRYISARIATNRSSGTIPELIKIARLVLLDENAAIFTTNWGGGEITIRVDDMAVTSSLHAILLSFLQDARSAGVRLLLETTQSSDANTFCFAGGEGLGFATTGVPGSGGSFASVDD